MARLRPAAGGALRALGVRASPWRPPACGSWALLPPRARLHGRGLSSSAAVPAAVSSPAPAVSRGSSFRESQDQVALSERQEAFLLERLPRAWGEDEIGRRLVDSGALPEDGWRDRLLLMRSRLGKSIGRAMVAVPSHMPHVKQSFPAGTTYRPMDKHDIEAFVEQCERFANLSDDLRRLALPENFLRTITITEVPPTYGRRDVAHVVKAHCGVTVDPRDVVFRFKRWGRQSETCYVICPSQQEADHCVAQIQELAVPKRAAYGSLFGAAFLWSSRSSLFLSHPDLDFALGESKFWVFSTGWQQDMDVDGFRNVMSQLRFFPKRVVRHHVWADDSSAFFMEFDTMQRVKKTLTSLRRLKHRWRIKSEQPFFAYPRRIDVHRDTEDVYEDEDSADDSDLDEPAYY